MSITSAYIDGSFEYFLLIRCGDIQSEINTTEPIMEHGGVFIGNSRRINDRLTSLNALDMHDSQIKPQSNNCRMDEPSCRHEAARRL